MLGGATNILWSLPNITHLAPDKTDDHRIQQVPLIQIMFLALDTTFAP